jgi:hypothetical protein
MNPLNPKPPFVWPEPRALEKMCTYEHQPPFDELALEANSMFGIVSALTAQGVDVLESWIERNPALKVCLIVMVYPTCATREADLSHLLDLVKGTPDRLSVCIRPLERIADRATNVLCFLMSDSNEVCMVTGPSEDLGLGRWQKEQANFVFSAHPAMVEAFKRYFDWLWGNSREINAKNVVLIPNLVIPEGTEEGARMWRDYMSNCIDPPICEDTPHTVTLVDPDTGDVIIRSEDGQEITPPTEELGLAKLDQLAEWIARLYDKGALVSIDKLSRIPPLDAPLDPNLFGDASELHRGNVTRKVSVRVSIIDEKTLKEIDKRRQGLRPLLTKFSFGLADSMRWMPTTARELFESELKRVNEEGQKLILALLKGDVGAFIEANRSALVADINAMYTELGRPGKVTDDVIARVIENLKARLDKAQSANFMPTLSYSLVSFVRTENAMVSPWGQAFSLIAGIAAFPRKALTDSFFFRGLKVPEDDLIEVMNVADDVLCRDLGTWGIRDRCKAELELISRIEKASLESRDRCHLIWRLLTGDSIEAIDETLKEKVPT